MDKGLNVKDIKIFKRKYMAVFLWPWGKEIFLIIDIQMKTLKEKIDEFNYSKIKNFVH